MIIVTKLVACNYIAGKHCFIVNGCLYSILYFIPVCIKYNYYQTSSYPKAVNNTLISSNKIIQQFLCVKISPLEDHEYIKSIAILPIPNFVPLLTILHPQTIDFSFTSCNAFKGVYIYIYIYIYIYTVANRIIIILFIIQHKKPGR